MFKEAKRIDFGSRIEVEKIDYLQPVNLEDHLLLVLEDKSRMRR